MPIVKPIPGKPGHFVAANGEEVVLTEARETARYDSVEHVAGALTAGTTKNFFRNSNNKNDIDFNCPETGKLVTGAERLVLESIRFSIQQANATILTLSADMKRFLCHTYLEVKLNKNVIADGPAEMFPAGYGLAGMTNENNAAIASNGIASSMAVKPLMEQQLITDEHTIAANAIFQARTWLTTSTQPTSTNDVVLRLYMHGVLESAATNN